MSDTLREKRPNTELFLVRILLYLDGIQENMDQEITPYLDTFHSVIVPKRHVVCNVNFPLVKEVVVSWF